MPESGIQLGSQGASWPSLRHLPTSVFMFERDHECLHVQTHCSHLPGHLTRMRSTVLALLKSSEATQE
jgi:hypothetical protein